MAAARGALVPFGKDAPLFDCCDSVDQHGSQRPGRSWRDTVTCRLCRTSGGTDAKCGLDGVVCSAQEAVRFKQVFGQGSSNWLRRAFVRRGVMLVTSAPHYDARTGVVGWC